MILCGWCEAATAPDLCSSCGRDPALPYVQRNQEPPAADPLEEAPAGGRPALDAGQIKQRLRIALKELPNATNAQLAEKLDVAESTVRRWRKLAGL